MWREAGEGAFDSGWHADLQREVWNELPRNTNRGVTGGRFTNGRHSVNVGHPNTMNLSVGLTDANIPRLTTQRNLAQPAFHTVTGGRDTQGR